MLPPVMDFELYGKYKQKPLWEEEALLKLRIMPDLPSRLSAKDRK